MADAIAVSTPISNARRQFQEPADFAPEARIVSYDASGDEYPRAVCPALDRNNVEQGDLAQLALRPRLVRQHLGRRARQGERQSRAVAAAHSSRRSEKSGKRTVR